MQARGRTATTAVALVLLTAAPVAPCLQAQQRPGRTVTRDGVLSFALDARAGVVTVRDLLNDTTVAITQVCASARSGALSPDDVSFLVTCPSRAPMAVNTASFDAGPAPRTPPATMRSARRTVRNEVIVVGTIHAEHRTSTRYGTAVLADLLRAMRPDFVLTEIPPNRFTAANEEFQRIGRITESRVARFPEYVDVLFPLTRELPFTIIPTAGWTRPMDQFRNKVLRRLADDPARRAQWLEYQEAARVADSVVTATGSDDPYFINSAGYDSLQEVAHRPYNAFFNRDLGPGGWDNINEAHFGNIVAALDAHRGEGKRFVITYGAGHKEWFLRALRKRSDIVLLDVAPFLAQIGAKRAM